MQDNWNGTLPVGTFIPIPSAGNGWACVNDGNGLLSATIPGPYPTGQIPYNPGKLPIDTDQEKPNVPSIDPYITPVDRCKVASLPPEGKQEFSKNVHEYIGQLGKDYGVDNAAG